MVTEFDLAEKMNLPVDAVRAWLRKHGYGGKRNRRIPPSVERAFYEAHGRGREPQEMLGGRVTQPLLQRAGPPTAPAPPRTPDRPTQPMIVQTDYARQLRDLQTSHEGLRTELASARAERDAARSAAREARDEARSLRPRPAAEDAGKAETLRQSFRRLGLGGRHAHAALRALIADDAGADALLDALEVLDPAPVERARPVCAAMTCRDVAAGRGWLAVTAGGATCAVCKGSDDRRWFQLLALRLLAAGRDRIVLVGGPEAGHRALHRLAREVPRLTLDAAEPKDAEAQHAHARLHRAGVVVFWTEPTSDPALAAAFREAARRDAGLVVATASGSPANVARAVLDALEIQGTQKAR